ncbi:MAG TPA: hypothetical protein VK766_04245 [Cytophagaceae bacterium]|jgi:hypothetical protein|nr:hypothetical protein [Cytophagaceae bacterium]
MKTIKKYSLIILVAIGFVACEGKVVDDYDNAGLTEKEQAHTRALIDSSLVKLRNELALADSIANSEMRKEISALREEVKSLKEKK